MRTGSEPVEARSALKTRRALALWGLVWAAAGVAIFVIAGRPGWAAACAVVVGLAAADLVIVCRHIRQGPHYQPGKDVPPYEPDWGRTVGYIPSDGRGPSSGRGPSGDRGRGRGRDQDRCGGGDSDSNDDDGRSDSEDP
ncbi:DUF6343 family protein [Streptomyces niger]|uniref:DUF6343 family protein n=1 Tax=Streptomyces niger TaxID=66373 RepID=UPI001F261A8E|nr:DUF6343 family protein [Streptomyces niger]